MIDELKLIPNWAKYNLVDKRTQALQKYWESKTHGGGSLIGPISSSKIRNIKTPLSDLIQNTDTYDFYTVKKLQLYNGSTWFHDMWILTTRESDGVVLQEIENRKS